MHKSNTLQGKYIACATFIFLRFNKLIQHNKLGNNCINNFNNKIYRIDLSRKVPYVNFTCNQSDYRFLELVSLGKANE